MTYKFDTGCLWEGDGFEIKTNVQLNKGDGDICKHCIPDEYDKFKTKYVCAKVVVASNEGGYNSTGVCLDCILEANEKINNL